MNQDLANLLDAYRQDPTDSLTHLALADQYDELGDRENSLAHRWVGVHQPRLFQGSAAYDKYQFRSSYYYSVDYFHWYREDALPAETIPALIWDHLDKSMKAVDSGYAYRSAHRSSLYASFTTKLRAYDVLLETLRALYVEYASDLPRELQVVRCSSELHEKRDAQPALDDSGVGKD